MKGFRPSWRFSSAEEFDGCWVEHLPARSSPKVLRVSNPGSGSHCKEQLQTFERSLFNSSSLRTANCKWRGMMRVFLLSRAALPANSRTSATRSVNDIGSERDDDIILNKQDAYIRAPRTSRWEHRNQYGVRGFPFVGTCECDLEWSKKISQTCQRQSIGTRVPLPTGNCNPALVAREVDFPVPRGVRGPYRSFRSIRAILFDQTCCGPHPWLSCRLQERRPFPGSFGHSARLASWVQWPT